MKLIIECPFGHELHGEPWIDADGNFRVIVSDCLVCAGIALRNDKDDVANLIE
jgi:hypothetical protein